MLAVTLAVTVLAAAGALLFNRRVWRPRQASGRTTADGLTITEVAVPLASLAVLLLVFVLVQNSSSWANAGRAESDEATATLLLFREADLVRDAPVRTRVRAEVVCYARSVIGQEWPAMADGKTSSVPAYWAALVRRTGIAQVRSGTDVRAGRNLVKRDGERARARQERLGEARSVVPTALYVLMLLSVVITLVVIGVVTAGAVGPRVHVAIVAASAVVFAGTLILIGDLDQPYNGLTARAPAQTAFVLSQMRADVRAPVPCGASGLPSDDPGFRAGRTPLR